MKITRVLLALCLLAACSSGPDYKKHFSGNKFKLEMKMDSVSSEVADRLKMFDIQMEFKNDSTVTYKASFGGQAMDEQTSKWRISHDSLLTKTATGEEDGIKLLKIEGNDIYAKKDSVTMIFKKI